ncbi:putative Mn2+ efflux pump MntP [Desulfitispora alkaliphila]|uniref:manganese efflux pump MntP n=1 Tax=Desulfitispora alkaliphila TaxID=622674 RepID=UPI003D1A2680
MTTLTLLVVAIALGTDAFSMAVGIGAGAKLAGKKILLVSGVIAIFHVIMPLVGLTIGSILGQTVGDIAIFIGAAVLILIGAHMIREGFKGDDGEVIPAQGKQLAATAKAGQPMVITSFWGLMVLAASVSIDALTVGFGLGTMQANVLTTVLVMGAVAGIMTAIGLIFGRKLGNLLGEKAIIVGGIILVGIGIHMIFF